MQHLHLNAGDPAARSTPPPRPLPGPAVTRHRLVHALVPVPMWIAELPESPPACFAPSRPPRPRRPSGEAVRVAPLNARNTQAVERFNAGALDLAALMKNTTRTISSCERSWTEAIGCVLELQKARHPATGEPVRPDCIVLNAAIKACARAGRDGEAIGLFNDIIAFGHTPDAGSYRGAISACAMAGNADDALGLYAHLKAHGPRYGVFAPTALYNSLLSVLGQNDRTQEARALYREMREDGPTHHAFPNAVTFTSAIWACGADMAQDLLEDAIAAGVFRPTLGYDAVANTLDLSNAGVLRMPDPASAGCRVSSDVTRAIFRHLCRQGKLDPATRFVVGPNGPGRLWRALDDCMAEMGWIRRTHGQRTAWNLQPLMQDPSRSPPSGGSRGPASRRPDPSR